MSNLVYLSKVRLSFPTLLKPESSVPGGQEKYSADFIMLPTHAGFAEFYKKYGELALDKWGAKAQPIMGIINNDRKLRCYGSGAERTDPKTFLPYNGYENMVHISANCVERPQIIDAYGKPVPEDNTMLYMSLARKLYGGCYVNAAIQPWLQDSQHGRAVRCELVALQFLENGEAFGMGTPDAAPLFGAVAGAAPATTAAPLPDWM